jgi:hypothetical protein
MVLSPKPNGLPQLVFKTDCFGGGSIQNNTCGIGYED